MASFFVGQRVIVNNNEIVTIIAHRNPGHCLEEYDVKFVCGLVQFRRPDGIKPLPNGQL